MKNLFYILFLLFINNTYGQTDYHRGFEAGYKAGYCYGKVICDTPLIPAAPVSDGFSFKDGYNKGFQMGLDKQRGLNGNSPKGYKGTPATFIENAMFKLPFELIMSVKEQENSEIENKYGTNENRVKIFEEFVLKAVDAFNEKSYYNAIEYCKLAENTFLTNPMIDMILGGSYYFITDYDKSIFHLKKAKRSGYIKAEEYITLIENKEKEMTYERPIKFGIRIGYNVNSLKSSPIVGLFMQGRTGKWGIKNFSVLTEFQFFQAQYNQEIEESWMPNGKRIYENKDNILQTNLLFKNSFNKRIALVYGIGMSAGLESQSVMFDVNAGFQYHFSQYFFTEIRYNRNLTRSYFQGDGNIVYEPNNFQLSLGYKF